MEQLAFFDTENPSWKLVGYTYDDMYFLHESCGYTYPFFCIGYGPLKSCPCCKSLMDGYYYSGGE